MNHFVSELIIDFANIMSGSTNGKVKSKIILTSQHAKRLSKIFRKNAHRFKQAHEEIRDYEKALVLYNFEPTGQA